MIKIEDLLPNTSVSGIIPDSLVTVVNAQWFGSDALELTYETTVGKVENLLLYRYNKPSLEVVEKGRPWSIDGEGDLFRLISEANRLYRPAHDLTGKLLKKHLRIIPQRIYEIRRRDHCREQRRTSLSNQGKTHDKNT